MPRWIGFAYVLPALLEEFWDRARGTLGVLRRSRRTDPRRARVFPEFAQEDPRRARVLPEFF